MDRVFGSFNFYDNVNSVYNNRTDPNIGHVNIYRQMYGFEKTILDGTASFGIRETINSINVNSVNTAKPTGGMFTAAGYLSFYTKYVLLANRDYNRLLTAGLDFNFPVGPASIGGYRGAVGFRDTLIQPYLAFLWVQNDWFFQGFTSINVATDHHDTTMYFNDLAVGYYLFRAENPNESWLTAIIPTAEVHINTPLNNVGFNIKVPGSTPDSVNATVGATFVFGQRSFLTLAYATPMTGPHPFDNEAILLYNFRFGGMFGPRPDNSVTPNYSAMSAPSPGVPASAPASGVPTLAPSAVPPSTYPAVPPSSSAPTAVGLDGYETATFPRTYGAPTPPPLAPSTPPTPVSIPPSP